jgi:hypothetical protein
MSQMWDSGGEADVALARVVQGFGPQVLGRADMLEGLLLDNVPQLPREVAMLVEAARSGVADLLTERVGQGISPQAAVSMAAAEMTARTAVDASGAPWAAAVFARVLGYPVPTSAVAPAPTPPAEVPTAPAPLTRTPQTRAPAAPAPVAQVPTAQVPTGRPDAWGLPGPGGPGTGQVTIGPGGPMLPVVPPVRAGRGLAVAAAVTACIGAPMDLLWGLDAGAHGTPFWLTATLLLAAFGTVAIWVAVGWRGGAGFAAVLGLTVPIMAAGCYLAAGAASYTDLSTARRLLLELIAAIFLVSAFVAAGIAVSGLARWHQLARNKPGFLLLLLAAAGVGYALANILAQDTFQGRPFDYVLGPGVTGRYILCGIAFLVFSSAPPVLAAFLVRSAGVRLAILAGWLIAALCWQVSNSPTEGLTAAPGLYLTWVLWAVVLAGTAILAGRKSADAAVGPAATS